MSLTVSPIPQKCNVSNHGISPMRIETLLQALFCCWCSLIHNVIVLFIDSKAIVVEYILTFSVIFCSRHVFSLKLKEYTTDNYQNCCNVILMLSEHGLYQIYIQSNRNTNLQGCKSMTKIVRHNEILSLW